MNYVPVLLLKYRNTRDASIREFKEQGGEEREISIIEFCPLEGANPPAKILLMGRDEMTAKKVWGVIIILLGISSIYNGVSVWYMVDIVGPEIQSMGLIASKYGGAELLNANYYLNILEQQKIGSFIGILIGIAMAIGGTLLLREKRKPILVKLVDDLDETYKEWRF